MDHTLVWENGSVSQMMSGVGEQLSHTSGWGCWQSRCGDVTKVMRLRVVPLEE